MLPLRVLTDLERRATERGNFGAEKMDVSAL